MGLGKETVLLKVCVSVGLLFYFTFNFAGVLKEEYCRFTNSWLSDDADLEDEEKLGLVDITAEVNREIGLQVLGLAGLLAIFVIILSRLFRYNKVKTH